MLLRRTFFFYYKMNNEKSFSHLKKIKINKIKIKNNNKY